MKIKRKSAGTIYDRALGQGQPRAGKTDAELEDELFAGKKPAPGPRGRRKAARAN